VEVLSRLSWIDLAIILALAAGVFVGFTQGMIRYVLNVLAVILAFVLASQLAGPLFELLSFWTAFTPEVRELVLFIVLFVGFVIGGWFIIRAFYRRTRLPIAKQLDEIGGAIFGLVWAAVLITFQLLVLDSVFAGTSEPVPGVGGLRAYYDAMNSSLLVEFFRETIIPTAGFLARPFVPSDIARLLER
jgi:uncharacterized membrane protein required for colicin V production